MTPNGFFTGCVEDRNDPLKLGRCKVRIVGLHTEDKMVLPTEDLPWAIPVQPITSAGTSGIGTAPIGPVEGTWVVLTFFDPDQQVPVMFGTLTGVAQLESSADTINGIKINNIGADGEVEYTTDGTTGGQTAFGTQGPSSGGSGSTPSTTVSGTTSPTVADGKVLTDGIVGPLGQLIAKAESGSKGYNAFNRGTAGGKIIPAGGNLELTSMTIKEIMTKQALPPGSSDRLFAVGKYQCIPSTLAAACKSLNISEDERFTQVNQDIICQEYLVAKKRPQLVAYYRNPDKNNETLLMNAGKALAAEFASIEDPYNLGYPYGGQNGTYYKGGNRAHTMWSTLKPTLIAEWEFRNNKKSPPVTASLGGNDKVDKGTDYSGVEKLKPVDDSEKTGPTQSQVASSSGEIEPIADPVLPDPQLDALGDATGLGGLGFGSDLLSQISAGQAAFAGLEKSLGSSLNSALGDVLGKLKTLAPGITSTLSQFGGSINEIAGNLGIPNISGSATELANNLGLHNPSQEDVLKELANRAGSAQGQARALLTKLQGEPSKPEVVPLGERRPDGTISNGSNVDPKRGFQDPNGKYPKYAFEQDTNRLATGNNLGRTIVLKKEALRETGIKIANGGTFDQPPIPYNAKYPYNKVTQTESGHVSEFDDTPENQRIHTYHTSGTFTEIDVNGTQVNQIIGDGFIIVERNGHVYVKGAYNVTVDGAMNLRTDNIFNLEVSGAANINVYNDAHINISGNTNLAVGGALNAKANQINMESIGQFNIRAGTGLNIHAGSDLNTKVEGSIFVETMGDISHKSLGVNYIQSDADVFIKSVGLVNLQADDSINVKAADVFLQADGGQMNIQAGGLIAMDGEGVDMQNGSSEAASEAANAKFAREANLSEIELPVETRGGSGTSSYPPLIPPQRGNEAAFETQSDSTSTAAYAAYRSSKIATNEASSSEFRQPSFVKDEAKPTKSSAAAGIASDVSAIMSMDPATFNAGMRLSKDFTLGDLTAGGIRIPRKSYSVPSKQGGAIDTTLTANEIVANLKRLCDNVLQPIADKYGRDSFTITSCFRRPSQGPNDPGDLGLKNKTNGSYIPEWGDHTRGQAVDISFKAGKARTFEIVKELPSYLKSWHQLIMEYDRGGAAFWIHCSYRDRGNAGHCFSMNNHKICVAGVNSGFVLV